jgi:hypothetical protein
MELTKQEKHIAYKKCLFLIESGEQTFCCAAFINILNLTENIPLLKNVF